MDAIPAEVWSGIWELLPNSALCSLSGASKACWQLSCHKRMLKVELEANDELHSRLVSLLYFLTSRRRDLQVCCFQSYNVTGIVLLLMTYMHCLCHLAGELCAVYMLPRQKHTVWLAGDSLGGLRSAQAAQ